MDGVGGLIKRVVFGLVKSNKIMINTPKESATGFRSDRLQRLCHLFNQSTFPKMMRKTSDSLSKQLHTFMELLILIMWNILLTQMEDVFQNFIDHRTILSLFTFNIILEQTLFCAIITQVQRATKISVVFVKNFIMKMKRGFSVLIARYGSMKNVFAKQLFI